MEKLHQTSQNTNVHKECENCSKLFIPKKRTNKNLITKTCSKKCRYELRQKSYIKSHNCKNSHCGKMFTTAAKNADGFCSVMCRTVHRSQTKYQGTEGIDYIVCPLCNLRTRQFNPRHAQMHGFASIKEMQKSLNLSLVTCEKKKEKSQGENNPGFQHGGKLSLMSKNYIHGYNNDWHNNLINDNRSRNLEQPELFKTNIAFWLKETNGDEDLAQDLYRKFQTRDLAWFIEKYGNEEGIKRHQAKTNKWMKSFKKVNFSKISQTLFDEILKRCNLDKTQIYYATFDRDDMKDYINKEYILRLNDNSLIRPDFIVLDKKLIIEFDGEYWHSTNNSKFIAGNTNRDEIRDNKIISSGYKVYHVSEKDYKEDKEMVIEQCIQFLKQ